MIIRNLNEILAFATERLADYKVPETLEIVDKIPRNTLGKIDRRLLLTMISKCESRDILNDASALLRR
jgi:acyl-CoA synthetase (AMP-forming)/AMP-acid ligase II